MTTLFYIPALLFLFIEVYMLLNTKEFFKHLDDLNSESDEAWLIGIIGLIYIVWTIVGLFTFYWPIFAALILLYVLDYTIGKVWPKNKVGLFKLKSFLSIGLLSFAFINKMWIEMDVVNFMSSWF